MIYKYAIDFGTTNSSIALRIRNEKTHEDQTIVFEIQDSRGLSLTMPSVIFVSEDTDDELIESLHVGHDAKEYFANCSSEHKYLVREIKLQIDQGNKQIHFDKIKKAFNTVNLTAAILKKLKDVADQQIERLEVKVHGVVMGVPVSFSDYSKSMLQAALVKAGFYADISEAKKMTEFVSEPVAVAVAYGVDMVENRNVMVFDFGGGTLDIAILQLNPKHVGSDSKLPHDVLAKSRLTLGGEDITKVFFEKVFMKHYHDDVTKYYSELGLQPEMSRSKMWNAMSKTLAGFQLQEYLESLKLELSNFQSVHCNFIGPDGVYFGEEVITRREFESALEGIIDQILTTVYTCIENANLNYYDIDDVLLSGGSAMVPCIQDMLIEDMKFGSRVRGCTKKKAIPRDVLTSIVRGLSVYACTEEILVADIVDLDYGVWDDEHECVSVILRRGTKYADTLYSKSTASGGCSKDYRVIRGSNQVAIRVFQQDITGVEQQLGTIDLLDIGSGRYRVFMRVDQHTGCLIVDIYDREYVRWYDDIPLEDREFYLLA